ncbi:hypothetical protein [Glaciihabitans sp. UYNi722]|uniref:hypothetical protein n=1 Tax=Glaciihabitans sp. UYNi722 TaxID=3156344 RepID=UPI00339694CB
MSDVRSQEIWILGATGRVGRSLANGLTSAGVQNIVLVGRSAERLESVIPKVTGAATVKVLAGFDEILTAVREENPLVVVNLLGSYGETAIPLAEACMPNGSYVDLAVDIETVSAILALHSVAVASGSSVITGAGFGVLATEALVVRMCANRPTPERVQIDALASYASEEGVMGEAFAVTSVDVITTGGRVYRDGRLVAIPLGSNLRKHELPDGTAITSAAVPSAELVAAHNASGAPNVEFTSGLAPTAPLLRAMLPLMSRLLTLPAMRRMMIRQMAASKTKAAPAARPHSWGHAVIEWAGGSRHEGWLRADDAMEYTSQVLSVVIDEFTHGTAPRGAFTPAAAFGANIAVDAGATFIDA